MTAHSETFCDTEVRDAAAEVFGNLIPKYRSIKIPEEWRNIWSDERYPHRGTITYEADDGTVVAIIHFDTKFDLEEGHNGPYVFASPSRLVLELPDGRKFYDKQWLMNELKEHVAKLTRLRDTQEVIQCNENKCLCNAFDRVLDGLNDLMEDIRIGGEDYGARIEMRTQM